MRVIRVHVEAALAPDSRVKFGGAAAAHVTRVLRLKAGDAVTLFNGDGSDYPSRLVSIGRNTVEAEVAGSALARTESRLAITLIQGIARAERMDLVVQKATELGVAAILPVATARSVVKLDRDSRERKLAHWRGIAVSACEQCGRARIPSIAVPRTLAEQLAGPPSEHARLLLTPGAQLSLGAAARGETAIEILVGPEGGLTDGERQAALDAGYRSCRLGPRVLRSETAAIAALAVIQAVTGDLG